LSYSAYFGKVLLFLAFGFVILPTTNHGRPTARGYFLQETDAQKAESVKKTPPLIKENTVVFICPSQEEYDDLIRRQPERQLELTEVLSDFYHYSEQAADMLKARGIATEFRTWSELWFESADGKVIKKTFQPDHIIGLALYPKGKLPQVTTCSPDLLSLAAVIWEYFGIKLERSS